MSATPTPNWRLDNRRGRELFIIDADGQSVARTFPDATGDAGRADLIVRAVNSHAALVEALEAWQRWYESMQTDGGRRLLKIPGNSHVLHAGIKGREALALAKP